MSVSATIELAYHRRGRVWIGELPDASYIPIDTVNLERDAPPSTSKGLRLGAVEVFIPTGGRWLYGLVGGTFDADVTGKFRVDVAFPCPA
jgi:hypothetical protein